MLLSYSQALLGIYPANHSVEGPHLDGQAFLWLRELDLNQRPPGYEPDELPNCSIPRHFFYNKYYIYGAEDRNRTGTMFDHRRILSPVRLPVPPPRHLAPRVGLEPTTYRLTAGCSTIELPKHM